MRILIYSLTERGGGVASHDCLWRAMARAFPEDQLVLVCMHNSPWVEPPALPNVHIVSLTPRIHKEFTRIRLACGGLSRLARSYRADVIWAANIGSLVAGHVPQVLSLHNAFQVCEPSCFRLLQMSRIRFTLLRYLFRHSLAVSAGSMVQTKVLGDLMRAIRGCPARMAIIPKAVETEHDCAMEPLAAEAQQQLARAPAGAFRFLYVATAMLHKNHATLLDALVRLCHETHRPVQLVLTLAPDEVTTLGGDRFESLMKTGRLAALGWIPKPQLKSLYDACDACVIPSLLESLSSAHLEAMHWGKPQIVADLPYAHDLCGDAAVYCDPHDPSAWATAMSRILSDTDLRGALVERAYNQIQSFPQTWDEVARRVRGFLVQVAAECASS